MSDIKEKRKLHLCLIMCSFPYFHLNFPLFFYQFSVRIFHSTPWSKINSRTLGRSDEACAVLVTTHSLCSDFFRSNPLRSRIFREGAANQTEASSIAQGRQNTKKGRHFSEGACHILWIVDSAHIILTGATAGSEI